MPLTAVQIETYLQNPQILYAQLGLAPNENLIKSEYIDFMERLNEVLQNRILPAIKNNPGMYLLHTHRLVVDESINTCVGGIGFFITGNVARTGYFTFAAYEKKGYAAQALALVVQWLWQNTGVNIIEATIPHGHIASQGVVLKNGFVKTTTGAINTYSLYKN